MGSIFPRKGEPAVLSQSKDEGLDHQGETFESSFGSNDYTKWSRKGARPLDQFLSTSTATILEEDEDSEDYGY